MQNLVILPCQSTSFFGSGSCLCRFPHLSTCQQIHVYHCPLTGLKAWFVLKTVVQKLTALCNFRWSSVEKNINSCIMGLKCEGQVALTFSLFASTNGYYLGEKKRSSILPVEWWINTNLTYTLLVSTMWSHPRLNTKCTVYFHLNESIHYFV